MCFQITIGRFAIFFLFIYVSIVSYGFHVFTTWMLYRLDHLLEIKQALVLPEAQRMVVTLRDVEGWTSEELCNVLEIPEIDQGVLLPRARSKVRSAVERYFAKG